MPTPTYTAIASTTLGSAQTTVSFTNFSGYRDLVLIAYASHTGSTFRQFRLTVNSDTGTNYVSMGMGGDGSTVFGTSNTGLGFIPLSFNNVNTGQVGIWKINFLDYSATDKHKGILAARDASIRETFRTSARWINTSAITSIQLFFEADQVATGSTFALYGVIA